MELDSGSEKSTLDDKGRINIPVKFREFFQGELILTWGTDPCALIMKPSAWEHFKGELNSEELTRKEKRFLKDKHINQAQTVGLDNQGRIPIDFTIRKYANLTRLCMVVRDKDRMTIWDFEGWYEYLARNETDARTAYDKLEL